MTGTTIVHAPYKGGAMAINDLIAGHVQVIFESLNSIAPAGLPPAVLARLNSAVNEGIRAPIFVDRFAQIGDEPAGGTPQDFADTIRRDSARWGEVVRRSGAKID